MRAVSVRWLTIDPEAAARPDPVWRSNWSRLVAEEFHGVAAFDRAPSLGEQAFELDRAGSRAILFLLAALLGRPRLSSSARAPGDRSVEEVTVDH